jgi:hypothetical protein
MLWCYNSRVSVCVCGGRVVQMSFTTMFLLTFTDQKKKKIGIYTTNYYYFVINIYNVSASTRCSVYPYANEKPLKRHLSGLCDKI